MKAKHLYLFSVLAVFFFFACQEKEKDQTSSVVLESTQDTATTVLRDTVPPPVVELVEKPVCEGSWEEINESPYKWKPEFQLVLFDSTRYMRRLNGRTKQQLRNVKAVNISGMGQGANIAIPDELKNIETVIMGTHASLEELTKLKRLKRLSIFGGKKLPEGIFHENLEVLCIEKGAHIKGLSNLKSAKNIKKLGLYGVDLKDLPSLENFKELVCFEVFACQNMPKDLSAFDFSGNPCLKVLQLHTWGNCSGIPQGIDTQDFRELHIYHYNLTEEEKAYVEQLGGCVSYRQTCD